MKIYTKTGDQGTTGLWGGKRVNKDSIRVIAYGCIDELNAVLGVARASGISEELDTLLQRIQNELFVLGADLSNPEEESRIDRISEAHISHLEQEIDLFESQIEPLKQFILPGGSLAAAHLHLARTVCRRAERHVVMLAREETINVSAIAYINRLSDWFFMLARLANVHAGVTDVAVTYHSA